MSFKKKNYPSIVLFMCWQEPQDLVDILLFTLASSNLAPLARVRCPCLASHRVVTAGICPIMEGSVWVLCPQEDQPAWEETAHVAWVFCVLGEQSIRRTVQIIH